jgi:hypothetical protein
VPELERAKLPHVPNLAGSNRRDLQSDNQVHGRTLVSRLGSEARRWAKFRRTIQDGSSEPGCSRDQKQSCPTATTPIARATRAVRSNFAGRVMPNSAQNSMPNNSQSDSQHHHQKHLQQHACCPWKAKRSGPSERSYHRLGSSRRFHLRYDRERRPENHVDVL